MPRKNPLQEREREICARLRKFRLEATHLSRVQFARLVGLDAGRLGSYEHGFAQLNFLAAATILSRFPINPRWLATGNGPMILQKPVDLPDLMVGERTPFSRVYDETLVAQFSPPLAVDEYDQYGLPHRFYEDSRGRVQALFFLQGVLDRWIVEVADGMISDFTRELYRHVEKMLKSMPEPDDALRIRRRKEMADAAAALRNWSTWRPSSSMTKAKTTPNK